MGERRAEVRGQLPAGVEVARLHRNADERGDFTELFRSAWRPEVDMVQWNAVSSEPNVLRGVHCHLLHHDYLTVVQGHASIGVQDLRVDSSTAGHAAVVEMRGDAVSSIAIPPGVAHGFYFHERSFHVYAVSEYWDMADELGCHWADGDLHIPWTSFDPVLSDRDATAPPLSVLQKAVTAGFALGSNV